MAPGSWRHVEEIYRATLDHAPEARSAYLDSVCGPDQELRRRVEAMLAGDQPAEAAQSQVDATVTMLVCGALGSYRVVSQLGKGGMGEVYRAHDPKLGRDVAIKTLPPALANDPERVARFRREARALASLNHPN